MSDKHTTIDQLKKLAQRSKSEIDKVDGKVSALSSRVDDLAAVGGEPNVITEVKVNGSAQIVADKAVDITVATKVSELTNDSKFQTEEDVAASIAAADHLRRKKVTDLDGIDPEADGADKYIYMVPKAGSDADDLYDEYMVLDGKVEHVGNTKVDLSDYVEKETGKGLSANDFTDDLKGKLDGIEMATDAEVNAMLDEVFGADEAESGT